MYFLKVSLVFFLQFLAGLYFVNSAESFMMGVFIMLFLSISIIITVKLFLSGSHPTLGLLVLFAKAPITIGLLYFVLQWPDFESISFLVGVLIVLPCLVIVSYRKL